MKYLLDTNTCIYIMNRQPMTARDAFARVKPDEVGISTVTLSELWFGVENSSRREQNEILLHMFTASLSIAQYDDRAAEQYGIIRTHLKKTGSLIGEMDLLIAAHAKALGVTLVTNNLREFRGVPGLKMENWVEVH